MRILPRSIHVAVLLLGMAGPVVAQRPQLSLVESLRRADSLAYPNRIAEAESRAAAARAASANQGLLPGVHGELGVVRTTDPLAGFGFLLRQRAVTPEAFDPADLNRPMPRTDVGSAVVGEVPILNLDAWAGRRAARAMATSATHAETWVGSGVELDVIRSYFGAILAAEQQVALAGAEQAVQAHLRSVESALRNGTVTRSDLLLVQVRLGEITTARLGARTEAEVARQRLALLLGTPGDTSGSLPATIPLLRSAEDEYTLRGARADVSAAIAQRDAADAGLSQRSLALLPRVNGFGRYEWHDASTPLSGRPMWTVGVMATWSPFSGGKQLAARQEASAQAMAARAGVEATEAAAALEVSAATGRRDVAEQAHAIAVSGVEQASEAHRIVERKYEGGLATIAELLEAQATELGARLAETRARYDMIVAAGTLRRASGADLISLATALDAAASTREQN